MPSITRHAQSSRAARRDELRDRLLQAVEERMAEGENFTELSVERLVAAAGISRSTFYVYFEDKGDLLRAWFAQIIAELVDAAAPWWKLDGEAEWDDLRAALARIVHTYQPHTSLMAAVYDAASYDATVRDEVQGMMGGNIAALRSHIRKGQKAGWITPDVLPDETASWLTWMAERGQHQIIRGASVQTIEALIDAYTDIVWRTLYALAPSRTQQAGRKKAA